MNKAANHLSHIIGLASLFIAWTFLMAPSIALGAFGISPPFVHATHLVPGANFSQDIYLVRDVADEDINIQATIEAGDDVKQWISLSTGLSFVIPKGTQQFPVGIQIKVPKDAPLAMSQANVRFVSQPTEKGQVAIALGAQTAIAIKVGDEVFEKFTPTIDLLNIEESWNPRVLVRIVNEGNIPHQFTGASYELLDKFGAVRLAYIQKTTDFPKTDPFAERTYILEFPVNFSLGLGEYWGKVDFYQNDKLVASQKTVFKVLPKGSLSEASEKFVQFAKDNWKIIAGSLGVIVLLVLVGSVARRRRKK